MEATLYILVGAILALVFVLPLVPRISRVQWRKATIVTPGENEEHAWIRVRMPGKSVWLRFTVKQVEDALRAAENNK